MTKKRWSAEEKYRIVMETPTTSEETAEICRKHGLSPNTFYPWMEKFLEAAKAAMAGKSNTAAAKALQKENGRLKTLLAESTLAVDALKKTLEGRTLCPNSA
ncbi:MAG: transposase [Thaumarchaeota archaeon]|nr:transposase [Nitrososphaerota archaeon]